MVAGIDAIDDDATFSMSFFTYADLLKGAERSSRKPEVVRRLERLTRQIPVAYRAGRSLCEHYAAQFTKLKLAGTPIGANNLWIACHALAEDATLVTHTAVSSSESRGFGLRTGWIERYTRRRATGSVVRAQWFNGCLW